MTQVLDSVKRMLAKQQWLAAKSLLYNYLNQDGAYKTAENLAKEFESYQEWWRGEVSYKPGIEQMLQRYLDDIELNNSLGFKVSSAAPEHVPASPTASAYEAMEVWLLAPKSSLGDLSTDLAHHCRGVAQSLEAMQLFDTADEFNLIATKAGRPGADQVALISKATVLFNEQVLPLIKELREPMGWGALKEKAVAQTATLQDIKNLFDALPKGADLKASLKEILGSTKSDTAKVILSKQVIRNIPA